MAGPNPLTWARYQEIADHLERANGKGELENVASDIQELGDPNNDPSIFRGDNGEQAKRLVDQAIEFKNDFREASIRSNLKGALRSIAGILRDRIAAYGGRRRRKTRRGRRGGYLPADVNIPAGQEDAITMEEIPEGADMVDFQGERDRFHRYYTLDTYNRLPSALNANGNPTENKINPFTNTEISPPERRSYVAHLDPSMPVVQAGGRRRGRKSRRKSLRQRK